MTLFDQTNTYRETIDSDLIWVKNQFEYAALPNQTKLLTKDEARRIAATLPGSQTPGPGTKHSLRLLTVAPQ
jgi:hypothetical protein